MSADDNAKVLIHEQLSALASRLEEQRETIMHCWRRANSDIATSGIDSSLTRLQFYARIPDVLTAFDRKLRAWPDAEISPQKRTEEKDITEHPMPLCRQNSQLREITHEWAHLQMCLLEELEHYALTHRDLEPVVMTMARVMLTHLCWNGIRESIIRYWRHHRSEALWHTRELEQTLVTMHKPDWERATAWRTVAQELRRTA